MNNCGNCEHAVTSAAAKPLERFCMVNKLFIMLDFSCPRFEPRAPELPEALKKWVPEWHSGNPNEMALVIGYYRGGNYSIPVWWKDVEWVDIYQAVICAPDFWCELP